MCIQQIIKVKRVNGSRAVMEDNRIVLLGSLTGIHAGDTLKVYSNLALEKVHTGHVSLPEQAA